jgi:hypothetical protein
MGKTARGITIDDGVWAKIKDLAIKENRPISNLVETILIKYLNEKENPGK